MTNRIVYHVTGRLRQVLDDDAIHPKILTPEYHGKVDWTPEEAFKRYVKFLSGIGEIGDSDDIEKTADNHFLNNPEYRLSLRLTHTYFSDNPLYLVWKMHKRKVQNIRRGLYSDDVAALKLHLDDSELRDGTNKHCLVFGSVENLSRRLIGVGIGYRGLMNLFYGKHPSQEDAEFPAYPHHDRLTRVKQLATQNMDVEVPASV